MYALSVGEPWDFVSPDGENIINGEIIKKIDNRCIVFRANYILHFQHVSGNILILSPRHIGYDFSNLQKSNYYATINGGLLMSDFDNNMDKTTLLNNSKFVFIGGIRNSQ